MKKALFILLAITGAFSFACTSQPTRNSSTASPPLAVPGATISVGLHLALKTGTDTYHFEVSAEEVTLKVNADQVRWVVNNFTDLDLSDVTIDHFKGRVTGNTDPFGSGSAFKYAAVKAHSVEVDLATGTSAILDTFDYEISAWLTLKDGRKVKVMLDPRIVVSS